MRTESYMIKILSVGHRYFRYSSSKYMHSRTATPPQTRSQKSMIDLLIDNLSRALRLICLFVTEAGGRGTTFYRFIPELTITTTSMTLKSLMTVYYRNSGSN